jgi:Prophage antirepressor
MNHNSETAKNQIHQYQFGDHQVRVILKEDGTAWFVAGDVAEALGYRESERMTRWLDDDEAGPHILGIRSENGAVQNREVTIISESGLYHAILKSRRSEAKRFRRWVTEEVLPTIRRTGSYTSSQPTGHIPPQVSTTPTIPVRSSPVGIMGPLFDVPKTELLFMGHKVSDIARDFRAAMQIARDLKGTKNPTPEAEEQIRITAMNVLFNMKGIDMRVFTTGRPFLWMNMTVISCPQPILGNALDWFHRRSASMNYWNRAVISYAGLALSCGTQPTRPSPMQCTAVFSRADGSEYTHLFWRPSIIPILTDLVAISHKPLQSDQLSALTIT